jgi:D-alanyl-D-alanine carboxypeptidase/D-alanyl-D-alanine-endopeptidase (penicillin-binding protein 4)
VNIRRIRSAALVLLVMVLASAGGAGGYLITDHLRTRQRHDAVAAPVPVPAALASATAAPSPTATGTPTAPAPAPATLAATLRSLVTAPALGGELLGSVLDGQTGASLYSRGASTPAAPASTTKLLTAAALLASRPASYRIPTSVLDAGNGDIVLVGGGDPTLTGAAAGKPGAYPDAARLSDLAADLIKQNVTVKQVQLDDDAFAGGPSLSPEWSSDDVPSSYAAPITAVMTDGARASPTATIRTTDPDLVAGRELAGLLGEPSIPVTRLTGVARGKVVATVYSAPISELVEQMLQSSDNVIAECLARQVAIAKGQPATFDGAAAAVRAVLSGLGVDPGGQLNDGSGLAASDRLTPASIAAVLALIVGDQYPALHEIVTALPVAGWSGTLESRFVTGSAAGAGAGVIRAKTGTLTSVSTLAGVVHDADGRLLVFAFMADQVGPTTADTNAAEAALDRVAAALAICGCS